MLGLEGVRVKGAVCRAFSFGTRVLGPGLGAHELVSRTV